MNNPRSHLVKLPIKRTYGKYTRTMTFCIQFLVVVVLIHCVISVIHYLQYVPHSSNNYSVSFNDNMNLSYTNQTQTFRNEITDKIFINCTFNSIKNYYECPKGINYYKYFLHNDTYNLNINNTFNCYWFKEQMFESLWRCDHKSIESKHNINISECAVVFSGGSLLLKKYGKEIDYHSEIFRFNYAPTKSYEVYVGTKTTFNVLHFWRSAQKAIKDMHVHQIQTVFLTFPLPEGAAFDKNIRGYN
eukprot:426617_1